jgi:hypothetical protein
MMTIFVLPARSNILKGARMPLTHCRFPTDAHSPLYLERSNRSSIDAGSFDLSRIASVAPDAEEGFLSSFDGYWIDLGGEG